MRQYCIFLMPVCRELDIMEAIRKAYDPLAHVVGAHTTIVFPFFSNEGPEEFSKAICEIAGKQTIIHTSLTSVELMEDDTIQVMISDEKSELRDLHRTLYSGAFRAFYDPRYSYHPHITVGKWKNRDLKEVRRMVSLIRLPQLASFTKLVFEEIMPDEESRPILTLPFNE